MVHLSHASMLVIKSFCMVGGGFNVGLEFLQKFGADISEEGKKSSLLQR